MKKNIICSANFYTANGVTGNGSICYRYDKLTNVSNIFDGAFTTLGTVKMSF